MRQVNCFLPVQIRIAGSARNLDLEALGNLVASTVESRLRFARESIASRSGIECWTSRVNSPVITFKTDALTGDVRAGIERTVRDAIERSTRQLSTPAATPGSLHGPARTARQPNAVESRKAVELKKSDDDAAAAPEPTSKSPAERQKAFWDALRATVLSRDTSRPEEQRLAVELLVELLDIEEAREILRLGLQIPALESIVRLEILERLLVLFDRGDSVWDLILSGTGLRDDELAEYKFFQWLELSEASETVEFLDRKLSGKDEEMQRKAAIVVAYLLPKEFDPEAEGLGDKFAELKKLAAEYEIWSGGSPGAESVRQVVYSDITALIDLCAELILELETSPHEDRFANADAASLEQFQQALRMKLNAVPGLDPDGVEDLETRLGQALQAAVSIASRARTIRENAELLIKFIGLNAGESGEVASLFELRHEYINVLTTALTSTRFTVGMLAVDLRYVDFVGTVATVKHTRMLDRLAAVSDVFLQARQMVTKDQSCDGMVEQLERMERVARQRLHGGSLSDVVLSETDIGVWGLQVAMFALYAAALRMTIGQKSPQLEQLRIELAGYFQKNDLKSFSDRAESIEISIEELEAHNRHEPDAGIHLLIAAVAASLTFGASQIVRLALLGQTLAVVRTADAVGTIVLLVDTGVFADDELDGTNLEFDKPVALGATAQSFLSNPAFLDVVRALGSSADNRPLLKWLSARLLDVPALNDISMLMNRVDTARWPAEISRFLLTGLSNCALVAGLDAQSPARTLDERNGALVGRYRHVIESNVLTEPEFEIIRHLGLELNQRARELAVPLRRLMSEEEFQSIEQYFQSSDIIARSTRFVTPEPLLVGKAGERIVRALPAPGDTSGLTRMGESNVYRFDPVDPPDLASMLSRYAVAGHGMYRYPSGLVRVVARDGCTSFLLEPGPCPSPE